MINNVSKNITFIHPPEKDSYNKSEIIGFRYYKYGHQNFKENEYFTLIKKYNDKYYILEKLYDTKFYNKNLHCYDIINQIIFNNKLNENLIYGDAFPHLIGFCYSLLYINNKNFIFLPPYIPNIDYPESLEEEFNSEELSENKSYVEPIIFNSHVSLIFIKVTDNISDNISETDRERI